MNSLCASEVEYLVAQSESRVGFATLWTTT